MSSTALWDGLAMLAGYPDVDPVPCADACIRTSRERGDAEVTGALERFRAALEGMPLSALQERYTATFDLSPACTLDLGWHLFGASHRRGEFMASLVEDLERAGFARTSELPDHLSHLLGLIGREAPECAAARAAVIAPAVKRVGSAVAERDPVYAALLDAVHAELETLTRQAGKGR